MIGRIRFKWYEIPCVAELGDDLVWTCEPKMPGEDVARYLKVIFDPKDSLTPSRGVPGYASFYEAVEWLGGEAFDVTKPPKEAGDGIF